MCWSSVLMTLYPKTILYYYHFHYFLWVYILLSPNDSMFPQLSITLQSDLCNGMVWTLSIFPWLSGSSDPLPGPLGLFQVFRLLLVWLLPICSIIFCSLARSNCFFIFFSLFYFHPFHSLFCFFALMAYQPLCLIYSQSHRCRRTVVTLFNPLLEERIIRTFYKR